METRTLGRNGLEVSAVGLGCMGMSDFYGPRRESDSLATLELALDMGVSFWDTADMYGLGENERLLGKVLARRRDEVILATKFGVLRSGQGEFIGLDGSPGYVRRACEASLERLGTDRIDLYYQHRMAPGTPIEETVAAMGRLVDEGKVRYLGLCEITADELRRAAAVHPIAALQYEYSLWTREVEGEILDACRELGVGLVAYSPMGRGFLTGKIRKRSDLAEDDWRLENPRFSEANLAENLKLVGVVEAMAKEKGCTPAQFALAWLLAQGEDVVPIPGTRRMERLEENSAATTIRFTPGELERIDGALPRGAAVGERY
jgi:aryl-alcohol dehydrogenase-like predicted oxidoreductase